MKKIVFATSNVNKIKEIDQLFGNQFSFLGLQDIQCTEEIPETQDTIKGNAIQKAEYVHKHYNYDCFAEDTGLVVPALNGAPGVYTARYGGPEKNPEKNMEKLMMELSDGKDRSAYFLTVIALILKGELHIFEGRAHGRIAIKKTGEKGFGYDPIFIPDGFDITFAQMSMREKNEISHRSKATKLLKVFLEGILS